MPPEKHVTLSVTTGTMIRAVLILLGVYLLWVLRDFIIIVLTAIVIASFVESAVPHFRKIRIGRVPAVIISYTIGISILAAIFYLFAPLLITEVYNLSVFLSKYIPDSALINYFKNEAFSGAKDVIGNLSEGFSLASLLATSKAFITNLSKGFFQTLSVAFGSLFNLVLITVISFFLSVQERGIANFLRIILPIQHESYAVDLWERSRRKIALWVKGQLVIALLDAVLVYLVLSLLGVKYALLLGILAGFMGLFPYGTLIALIPAVSVSYLSGGATSALLVAGAYLIIHEFEVFLFTPLLIKSIVGLSPLVVILSILIGYELGGIWGMILAIPIAVFVMELMSDLEKRKAATRPSNEPSK